MALDLKHRTQPGAYYRVTGVDSEATAMKEGDTPGMTLHPKSTLHSNSQATKKKS